MIGESYLRQCEWLASALGQMDVLGRTLEADPVLREAVHDLAQRVRAPLLFLIAGPAGAGKTTLLNALAGERLASAERDERRTRWYRFGAESSDRHRGEFVLECARPSAELEQLQLAEMPAPGGWPELRGAITGELFGVPDAVLFILPVPHPWDDRMWEFLKNIHALCPEKLVCVLQQSDLRSAGEVAAVAKHVEQKLHDLFGAPGRVVTLAATKVLAAYAKPEEEAHTELEACGYGNLERHLSDVLTHNEPRRRRLLEVTEEAHTWLGKLAARTQDRWQTQSRDAQRLSVLGRSVVGGKSDTVQHLTGALLGVARACDQAQQRGFSALEKALAPGALFALPFRGLPALPVAQTTELNEEPLRQTIRPETQRSLEDLERNFQEVWRHFHDTLQTDFATPLPPAPFDPPPVHERAQLLARIEEEAFPPAEEVSGPTVFWALHRLQIGLRVFWFLAVLAVVGCVLLARAQPEGAVVFGVLAALLIGGAFAFAARQRKVLLLENLHRLTLAREAAISAVERNLHSVVDDFYDDVNVLFEPLESFSSARKEFLRTFVDQIAALSTRLEKSAAALRAELGLRNDE